MLSLTWAKIQKRVIGMRMQERKEAKRILKEIGKNKARYATIHYSCEDIYKVTLVFCRE